MEDVVTLVKIQELDVMTIVYRGTVERNSVKTLVSGHINFPFNIERIRAQFPLNTNCTVRVRVFISPDNSDPASIDQTGHNLLKPIGQVDYIEGDDEVVEIPYRVYSAVSGMWVKIVLENLDSYEHTIRGQVFITKTD
jgi:hypothetical protein